MGICSFRNSKMLGKPLCVIFSCGLIGVLVDADHLIAYYYPQVQGGRFFHTAIFILSCVMLCGLVSYFGGLVLASILNRRIK